MRGIRMDAIPELEKMQGIEYVVLHAQEPILYVIRKQKRLSPAQTFTLTNYYIIAGVVYQAPDMQSIIQSKMLTAIHFLQSAFDECFQYARFHPSTDYYWNFSKDGSSSLAGGNNTSSDDRNSKESSKAGKENSTSKKKEISIADANDQARHMYRVDVLIHELVKKFPPKIPTNGAGAVGNGDNNAENSNPNINGIKSEPGQSSSNSLDPNAMDTSGGPGDEEQKPKPNQMTPPAKKPKLNWTKITFYQHCHIRIDIYISYMGLVISQYIL